MSRENVKDVVLEYLRDTVEELEDVDVDTSRSMKDLGVSSLDIVEVVSCSMRELRVRVPRTRLGQLTNIDELIDELHGAVLAKAG